MHSLTGLMRGLDEPVKIKPIDDDAEPIFIVRNPGQAQSIRTDLKFDERLAAGEISRWYSDNAFPFSMGDDEEIDLKMSHPEYHKLVRFVNREEDIEEEDGSIRKHKFVWDKLAGQAIAWKPVVVCFKHEKFFSWLTKVAKANAVQVWKEPNDLEELQKIKALFAVKPVGFKDMPQAVLDGWLGDVYRDHLADFPIALAWPALVTVAGTLVPQPSGIRTNLFCALVGPPGCGKSQAIERAIKLLGVEDPRLMRLKAGSGEGLVSKIGDVGDASRLFFPDELSHLMSKAKIENSSFPTVLNTAYYENRQSIVMAKQKVVDFSCQLSVIGGCVDTQFGEVFAAGTTGGLHDRFIFGQSPEDFMYEYEPFNGARLINPPDESGFRDASRPIAVEVDYQVWKLRKEWEKDIPGLTGRVFEQAIKVATICASFDGRKTLTVDDLEPAKEFARYQTQARILLQPNPGENYEGRLAHKFLNYLRRVAPDGEWVARREMLKATRGYDLGPTLCDRAISSLEYNGDLEQQKIGKEGKVKKDVVRLVPKQ